MAKSSDSRLSSGDYVNDPVHGLVPKDVPTQHRLQEQQAAGKIHNVYDPPVEVAEKVADTK